MLDSFKSPDTDLDGCLRDLNHEIVPTAILPLIAAPTASLSTIAQAVQFGIANSATLCSPILDSTGQFVGGTLKAIGREQPGTRFMIGLTALGDTGLYGLRNASLQTTPGHFV